MRKVLAAVVAVLVLVPSATADPPKQGVTHVTVPPGTPSRELGRQLFAANCASCHGATGTGISQRGPSVYGVGKLAADFYLRTGYMPLSDPHQQPRRHRVLFNERELRGMMDFVGSLGSGPGIPTPQPARGNLSEGLTLFTRNCAGCHQVVAEGGYLTGAVAPPLKDATPTQIAEAVRIGPYLMPEFSEKRITNPQLNSIIRYVQWAKHPDDRGGWSLGHVGPVPEGLVAWFIGILGAIAACLLIGRRLES